MNYILSHAPVINPNDKTISFPHFPLYDSLHNANDAGEFPDDSVHLKQHPLVHTEECIAAGCPEDLW